MKSSRKSTARNRTAEDSTTTPARISIRDLAAIASVSRTTVSLALRDSHRISASVRKRIQKLAVEHNYRSHPMVTALMQQVRFKKTIKDHAVIAFVTSSRTREEWKNYSFTRQIWKGAEAEASRLGFRLEEFWAGPGAQDSKALASMLYHRGIQALCFTPMAWPHPHFEIPWERFVSVACTASTGIPSLPVVRSDHSYGTYLLLSRLKEMGARTIGMAITRGDDERIGHAWSAGAHIFRQTEPGVGLQVLRMESYRDFDKFSSWFGKVRPDVVVGIQADIPTALERLGLMPGKDIAYASLDVLVEEKGTIAGIFQDPFYLGRRAVEYVSKGIYDQVLGLPEHPESIVVRGSFLKGKSLLPLIKSQLSRNKNPLTRKAALPKAH